MWKDKDKEYVKVVVLKDKDKEYVKVVVSILVLMDLAFE